MDAADRIIDIVCALSQCLATPEEPPAGWRLLADALLRVPGVRGVTAVARRDEAVVPLLRAGEMPLDAWAVSQAAQDTQWSTDSQGVAMAVVVPSEVPLLIAPLGRAGEVKGVFALAVEEMDARLARLATAVAASLSASLFQHELARAQQVPEGMNRETMARIEELATVGQLAASIAHELRNPLSSIKGAAQYLRAEAESQVVREFLDIILEEVGVLSRVTTEFLDFARPMHLKLQEANVHDSILHLLQLIKPQMTAQGITLALDLGEDVPRIRFDREQTDHALRNVLSNAVQAMADGGTLTVRTRATFTPLPGVEIAVSDTGHGIPSEDLNKLFTPFFTTKTKGVGLGLTIVQKIAQNHGGSVTVESQPGCGSTFTIRLPGAPGAENLRVR